MRILILGGGVMQLPAVRLAKGKGWSVVVAAANIIQEIQTLADRCEQVDLRDRKAVTRLARAIQRKEGLDGVFTAGTDFSTTVAWIAENLELPGIPYTSALAATDKARMRAAFQAQKVPSPAFFTVEKAVLRSASRSRQSRGAALLPSGFSFPLVVKPVDNMGARGVRRVDDAQQLGAALEVALEQSACGKAIVEQHLEGPELSLDAVIYDGRVSICGVADRHICFPPYFVEMGHTMPSVLDAKLLRRAEEVFVRGIRALGISQGAAKGDIKVTPEGPVVGEIAARLSGGYMSGWTFPFASGVEVTDAALNIAMGLPPGDLTPRRFWVSAERAFISIPGTIKTLEGLRQARDLPGIEELFLRVAPSQQVDLPTNNMGKCGNLISKAPTRAEALAAVQAAVQSVLVRLEVNDPRTDAYLQGKEQGEFTAFSPISPDSEHRLAALPLWLGNPERFSRRVEDLQVLALPGAGGEVARDWHGWTLDGAFQRVLEITGATASGGLPDGRTPDGRTPGSFVLGRGFWKVLIKGGVQAGVYLIDSLCDPASDPKQVVRKWSV
ncbi:MAG: ATP-grasp domain-containing protein [Spirochaetaceae bacterium]|nr:MAG: ATP-grasp domain-containing protein [Spirochaetaceae bacterium]